MANLNDADEVWRQIPPEEKLLLLNRSHSSGVVSALCLILIGAAFAIGLQEVWLFWGSFLVAPLVFQFNAGRTWRALKPATMLEFLAARSAARRFAFTAHAKDLTLQLLFRGQMTEVDAERQEQVDGDIDNVVRGVQETAVWIALFKDAVVLMTERPGGAQAQFAQPLTTKLEMEVENTGDGDYSAGKSVLLGYNHKLLGSRKVRVQSYCPAALVVFEKLIARRLEEARVAEAMVSSLAAKAGSRGSEEEAEY